MERLVELALDSESERDQRGEPIDLAAQQARPRVEALIEQAIRVGKTAGRGGGLPKGFSTGLHGE